MCSPPSCVSRLQPTQLTPAADSSTYFSGRLLPYVERAVEHANGKPVVNDEIDQTLERARIVANSELLPKHEWLQENVDKWRAEQSFHGGLLPRKKKILLLGSGLVAGPAVEVFLKRPDVQLVIGTCAALAFLYGADVSEQQPL